MLTTIIFLEQKDTEQNQPRKRCKGENLNCKDSKSEATTSSRIHCPPDINMWKYAEFCQPRSSPELQCVVFIKTSLFRDD